jgi:hypothetical protein
VPPEDTLTMVPSLIVKPLLVWPEPRSIVVTRPYFCCGGRLITFRGLFD